MGQEKKLIISRADWGQKAAEMLAECFVSPAWLHECAASVGRGESSLFFVDDGGEIIAAFVLRVDGREGVIVAASGSADVLLAIYPSIEVRFGNCESVRLHTIRPGLAKVVKNIGFIAQEIVMRKGIEHGR